MRLPFALLASSSGLLLRCAIVGSLLGASACGDDPKPARNTDTDNGTGDEDEDDVNEDEDDAVADDESDDVPSGDAGGGKMDGGTKDAGSKPAADAGPRDGGAKDGGGTVVDAGGLDAAVKTDAGAVDAGGPGVDSGAPVVDAGAEDAGPSVPVVEDVCHVLGNEVAVLGDSYIDLSGDFTTLLQDHARAAGALGARDTYIDLALSGASMAPPKMGEPLVPTIPTQFPDAVAEAKKRGSKGIKVVIMTGGGNDVLINERSCLEKNSAEEAAKDPVCVGTVDAVLEEAQKLFDTAVDQGVKATVFFFYPHLPALSPLGSLFKGSKPNNMLDYSLPRARELCEKQSKAPCYFVDMVPAFDDPQNPGWPRDGLISVDGIHPTLEGSKILAAEVWKVMQARCVASK
jgi:lysophospholipase L1-like esterase